MTPAQSSGAFSVGAKDFVSVLDFEPAELEACLALAVN